MKIFTPKTIEEHFEYERERLEWIKKRELILSTSPNSGKYDTNFIEKWTKNYTRDFNLSYNVAKQCVLDSVKISEEDKKIHSILLDEAFGKIDWQEAKKLVGISQKRIDELLTLASPMNKEGAKHMIKPHKTKTVARYDFANLAFGEI